MINTCANCGEYSVEKIIDIDRATVICPFCKYEYYFIFKSLLIVTGPSGGGKTTIYQTLLRNIPDVIFIEGDILWSDYYNKPESNYKEYYEILLRFCKNMIQSKVNVVVFNSGIGVPNNTKQCKEAIYFKGFKYLNLTCDEQTLLGRLQKRPVWRKSATEQEIKNQLAFKRWLDKEHTENTIDTSQMTIEQTSRLVKEWIVNNMDYS